MLPAGADEAGEPEAWVVAGPPDGTEELVEPPDRIGGPFGFPAAS